MKNIKKETNKKFYKKEIPDNGTVKVSKGKNGNITVKSVMGGNSNPSVRKIGKNTYINHITGELIESGRKSIKKGENVKSIVKSTTLWHDLISYNIQDYKKVLRFCLTFEDKTLDLDLIRPLYSRFIEKLRDKYTKTFGKIEYMYSPELYVDIQGYHLHGLLYFPNIKGKPYIDCKEFEKIWGNGDVDINDCQCMGDLFRYILPHSTNAQNDYADHMNEKYERLKLMPSNAKLVRHSRGITAPTTTTMKYSDFLAKYGKIKPTFERAYYKDFYYEETNIKFRVWFFYRLYSAKSLKNLDHLNL